METEAIEIYYDSYGQPMGMGDLADYFNLVVMLARCSEVAALSRHSTRYELDLRLEDTLEGLDELHPEFQATTLSFFMRTFARAHYAGQLGFLNESASHREFVPFQLPLKDSLRRFIATEAKGMPIFTPNKYEILSMEFSNPFWAKIGNKGKIRNGLKPLIAAIAICGGEIEVNDNRLKLPGLIDGIEKVTRLAIEVDNHYSSLETEEERVRFLRDGDYIDEVSQKSIIENRSGK